MVKKRNHQEILNMNLKLDSMIEILSNKDYRKCFEDIVYFKLKELLYAKMVAVENNKEILFAETILLEIIDFIHEAEEKMVEHKRKQFEKEKNEELKKYKD